MTSRNPVLSWIAEAFLQSDVVEKGEAGRSWLCVVHVGRCGSCSALCSATTIYRVMREAPPIMNPGRSHQKIVGIQ